MDETLLAAIERYTGQGYELETLTPEGVAILVRGDDTLQLRMENGEAIATVEATDGRARAGGALRLVRYGSANEPAATPATPTATATEAIATPSPAGTATPHRAARLALSHSNSPSAATKVAASAPASAIVDPGFGPASVRASRMRAIAAKILRNGTD